MVVAVVATHMYLLVGLSRRSSVWNVAGWLRCKVGDEVLMLESLTYVFHSCVICLRLEIFFCARYPVRDGSQASHVCVAEYSITCDDGFGLHRSTHVGDMTEGISTELHPTLCVMVCPEMHGLLWILGLRDRQRRIVRLCECMMSVCHAVRVPSFHHLARH